MDLKHLKTLPLGWRIFWVLYVLIVLLIVIQESTFVFYGPHRTVQGMHLHTRTVSSSWPFTCLLLLTPLTWLVAYSLQTVGKQLIVICLVLAVGIASGMLIDQYYHSPLLERSRWDYNVGPGTAWYGRSESKWLLGWIADPLGHLKPYLVMVSFGVWFVPLLLPNLRLRRAENALRTNTCFHCGYDLRVTTSEFCPECGKTQPSTREFY